MSAVWIVTVVTVLRYVRTSPGSIKGALTANHLWEICLKTWVEASRITPPKTHACPLKRDYFSKEYIFQPLIFRGHEGSIFSVKNSNQNLHFAIVTRWGVDPKEKVFGRIARLNSGNLHLQQYSVLAMENKPTKEGCKSPTPKKIGDQTANVRIFNWPMTNHSTQPWPSFTKPRLEDRIFPTAVGTAFICVENHPKGWLHNTANNLRFFVCLSRKLLLTRFILRRVIPHWDGEKTALLNKLWSSRRGWGRYLISYLYSNCIYYIIQPYGYSWNIANLILQLEGKLALDFRFYAKTHDVASITMPSPCQIPQRWHQGAVL